MKEVDELKEFLKISVYVGDGTYLTKEIVNGIYFCLWTTNGVVVTNKIYLEPHMVTLIQSLVEEYSKK